MAKVLIIDDTEQIRTLVGRFLGAKGYEVTSAENGELGVAAARDQRPDLILMDLNMPVMDGFKATRLIKDDPALSAIPVIALTAEKDTESRMEIYDAGCDAFVQKPIDFPLLVNKMEDHLK